MATNRHAVLTLDAYAASLSSATDGNRRFKTFVQTHDAQLRPEELVEPSEKQPFLYPPTPN